MITTDLLRSIAGHLHLPLADPLAAAMTEWLPQFDITGTDRVAIFLAQACHESDGFRTLEEYGGPAYWSRYDGRADLGNTEPGDGARYHGRGIFQLTGRANYRTFGAKLGVDLEGHPAFAAEPALSVRIACEYWRARGLNKHADKRDFLTVTRRINGGTNGLEDRARYWMRAWLALA